MESSQGADKIIKMIDDWSKKEINVNGKRNVTRPIYKINEIRNQISNWSDEEAVIALAYIKNGIGERETINQVISFMAMILSIISLIVSIYNHNGIEAVIVTVVAVFIFAIALIVWIFENKKRDYFEELLAIIEAGIKERD